MTYQELLDFRIGLFAFSYDDEDSWEDSDDMEEEDGEYEDEEEDDGDDW